MAAFASFLLKLLPALASKKKEALIAVILCFCVECIGNPKGAYNTFIIHLIDNVVSLLPSSPVTLVSLINGYDNSNPSFSSALISNILSLCLPSLAVYLVVKLYKFLPFT